MQSTYPPARELAITCWFNSADNPTLAGLSGHLVVIEAFQMLCPGCVSHGIPQAKRIQHAFGDDVTVLGLHYVFEHHDAMTPVSLEAFLHEYRITFPVGIDAHDPGVALPITMGRFQLRGTPSLIVIDRAGRIRLNAFGQIDDLGVGATIARLVDEPRPEPAATCDPDIGCPSSTQESNPQVAMADLNRKWFAAAERLSTTPPSPIGISPSISIFETLPGNHTRRVHIGKSAVDDAWFSLRSRKAWNCSTNKPSEPS